MSVKTELKVGDIVYVKSLYGYNKNIIETKVTAIFRDWIFVKDAPGKFNKTSLFHNNGYSKSTHKIYLTNGTH